MCAINLEKGNVISKSCRRIVRVQSAMIVPWAYCKTNVTFTRATPLFSCISYGCLRDGNFTSGFSISTPDRIGKDDRSDFAFR